MEYDDDAYDRDDWEPKQSMAMINGVSFKCEICGANVFTQYAKLRFRCNGCGELYTGEE